MVAPLIGITTSVTIRATPERAYVNAAYIRAVQEAGGMITQVDGSPLTLAGRSVLACAPAMHAELVARFRHIGA